MIFPCTFQVLCLVAAYLQIFIRIKYTLFYDARNTRAQVVPWATADCSNEPTGIKEKDVEMDTQMECSGWRWQPSWLNTDRVLSSLRNVTQKLCVYMANEDPNLLTHVDNGGLYERERRCFKWYLHPNTVRWARLRPTQVSGMKEGRGAFQRAQKQPGGLYSCVYVEPSFRMH